MEERGVPVEQLEFMARIQLDGPMWRAIVSDANCTRIKEDINDEIEAMRGKDIPKPASITITMHTKLAPLATVYYWRTRYQDNCFGNTLDCRELEGKNPAGRVCIASGVSAIPKTRRRENNKLLTQVDSESYTILCSTLVD